MLCVYCLHLTELLPESSGLSFCFYFACLFFLNSVCSLSLSQYIYLGALEIKQRTDSESAMSEEAKPHAQHQSPGDTKTKCTAATIKAHQYG